MQYSLNGSEHSIKCEKELRYAALWHIHNRPENHRKKSAYIDKFIDHLENYVTDGRIHKYGHALIRTVKFI